MNYEALEDSIVTRLSPFATVGVTVARLPENEEERKRALPQKAKFTVIYSGSEYEASSSSSINRNQEKIFVSVLIESSVLRGTIGIYNLVSVLKKALSGFKPAGCRQLELVKHHSMSGDDLVKRDNMWEYLVVFQTNTVHVEDFTEDMSVLISQITLLDGDDTTIIT